MAGNMEDILFEGGDDDSSDEEGGVVLAEGSMTAAANVTVPMNPATAPPLAPVPAPIASGSADPDRSARLKSLYSPSSKAVTQMQPQPMQQSQQLQQQQQQQQQFSSHISRASSAGVSSTMLPVTGNTMQTSRMPQHLSPQVTRPQASARSRPPDPFEPTPLTSMISRHSSHAPSSSSSSQQQHTDSSLSTVTVRTSNVPPGSHMLQQQQQQQQHHQMATTQQQPQHQRHMQASHHSSVSHHIQAHPQHQPQLQHRSTPINPSHSSSTGATHVNPSHNSSYQSSSSNSAAGRAQMERDRQQRNDKDQFVLFTRVLMKYLENKDPQMHVQARQVIRECANKNKTKEQGFESFTSSMKTRLRATVGEQYWMRAESYLAHIQQKAHERNKEKTTGTSAATSIPSSAQLAPGSMQPQQQPQNPQQQRQPPQQPAQQITQTQVAQQSAMQAQLAERQHNERLARERAAEQERQRKEIERKKATEELLRQKKLQAEKMRQHQEAAAKLSQSRDNTRLVIQNMKVQTEQPRAAATSIPTGTSMTSAVSSKRPADSAIAPLANKRKTSTASSVTSPAPTVALGTTATLPAQVRLVPEHEVPPREYREWIEMVDHAVDFDWTNAGLLLGSKADVDLTTEQRTLLYGDAVPVISSSHKLSLGWNSRNILSARTAWAKVRLPEMLREIKESQSAAPGVAGISLPADTVDSTKVKTTWLNEEMAETDKTLMILSEGMEIYLKQVLEQALQYARQRENLDGIRLWHAQHSGSKAPISLRLGCDVSRQVALAAGNAARTVQRMEEALERNPAPKCDLRDPEVLACAATMGDLACRPKLAMGAEKAAYQAKRSFEISGGKDALSPPFGRVPKQAKIMVHDFEVGMELTTHRTLRFPAFHFL